MRLEQDTHVRIMAVHASGTHWRMLSHTHAQVWCWSGGDFRRTVQYCFVIE